jgi:hypothetical protein
MLFGEFIKLTENGVGVLIRIGRVKRRDEPQGGLE